MRGTTLKTLEKSVRLLLIAYLTLPFLIFVGGWMKLYIAIPVILLVLFCAWKVYQDMPELWLPELTPDNLMKIYHRDICNLGILFRNRKICISKFGSRHKEWAF